MESHEETPEKATEKKVYVDDAHKELKSLIENILQALQTIKDEIIDNGTHNREFLEKKIIEVMDRQSNITENQQKLFDQLKEAK